MYRVGIIGCGRIGVEFEDCHAKAYEECPDTELVALCDKEEWKADRYLNEDTDLELVTHSYWDMLRLCKPDIVSVCTPPETHCQIVCDISPYVKAIYLEKPIALTLEDAGKMIQVCSGNKTILQINHQRDFTRPKMRFSRNIIDTGTHAFALLEKTFGWITAISKDTVTFSDGRVIGIEYIPTMDEHIFELDCTHNKERMIDKGVAHLVNLLDEGLVRGGNDFEAYTALKWALKYKELVEKT